LNEDKYPKVRIPKQLYDDIKRLADRKGKSMGDVIGYVWLDFKDWKKAEMPNEQKRKREFAEKLNEKVNEMKKQVEEQVSMKYEGRIKDLEDMVADARVDYEALEQEKQQWKARFEKETEIMPILKSRIDELENELKMFQSSDIDSLRTEIDAKQEVIRSKDSEIEKLKGIIEENKAKIVNVEQLINENEDLKEELSELPQENDNLRRALKNQGMENKLIKDTLKKGMENILLMESALDMKLAFKRLLDDIVRKIDYELQKQEEALI